VWIVLGLGIGNVGNVWALDLRLDCQFWRSGLFSRASRKEFWIFDSGSILADTIPIEFVATSMFIESVSGV
jgi:hypothetical protein